MMVPRRVVMVVQAEMLLVPKREVRPPRGRSTSSSAAQRPEPQTTLVFVAGTIDKRSRMVKLLMKHATVVECGAMKSG
jgi:hypothetical protein